MAGSTAFEWLCTAVEESTTLGRLEARDRWPRGASGHQEGVERSRRTRFSDGRNGAR